MCLSINTFEHCRDIQDHYKSKTTILPKKVYKILYIDPTRKNTYYTPYKRATIHFAHEKAVLEEPAMMCYYRNSWDILTVNIGIHAFYDKNAALTELTLFRNMNYAVFKAVIPPFTKYFIGLCGDIVCEKLIIKNKTVK